MEILKHFFSRQMSAALSSKGLGNKDVVESLDVDGSNVYRWLNGETLPSDENFKKLCELVDMTPNEILFPDGPSRAEMISSIVALLPSLNESELRNVLAVIESSPSISGATTRGLAR